MSVSWILVVLLLLTGIGYVMGRQRSVAVAGGIHGRLHSIPGYYGSFVAVWCLVPALAVIFGWMIIEPLARDQIIVASFSDDRIAALSDAKIELLISQVRSVAAGVGFQAADEEIASVAARLVRLEETAGWARFAAVIGIAILGASVAWRRVAPGFRARNRVETVIRVFMIGCSVVAVLTTFGIVISLITESTRFFTHYPILDFVFGLKWSPQTAIREDQIGSSGAFGAIPVFAGTLLISVIAMVVAVPTGLLTAIYLAEYAPRRLRAVAKPAIEILAGVPTVVYGYFAVLTVAPNVRDLGRFLGLDVQANSALAAGLVMGIMIIPFVSSLSDDVISAVPQTLRDGSSALGATRSETIRQVVFPAALPGIVGAVILAISRAIGETMIVVMAAGLSANLTANPLEDVTTVTVQIVANLTGDNEFDSAKTLSAFALGMMLFIITLFLNVIALRIVQRYREKYD